VKVEKDSQPKWKAEKVEGAKWKVGKVKGDLLPALHIGLPPLSFSEAMAKFDQHQKHYFYGIFLRCIQNAEELFEVQKGAEASSFALYIPNPFLFTKNLQHMSVPSQVSESLMSDEEILYNFEKPFTLKAPGLVFTNKRFICYKPKTFGVELKDYSWRDLHNVSMKEGLVNGEIKFEMIGDHEIKFKNIPKGNVREMYALAKEMKEKAHVSSKTVVMQQPAVAPAPVQEDPVAKLKQLKEMLDAGLISQEEYDKTKAAILARM